MKKRIGLLLAVIMVMSMSLSVSARVITMATPRASDQISAYGAMVDSYKTGKVVISATIDGTGYMTEIGVSKITLFQKYNNVWTTRTYLSSDFPAMVEYNSNQCTFNLETSAIKGAEYYAVVEFFARDARGADYRTYATPNIIAV